jgi:hypothetical protein
LRGLLLMSTTVMRANSLREVTHTAVIVGASSLEDVLLGMLPLFTIGV